MSPEPAASPYDVKLHALRSAVDELAESISTGDEMQTLIRLNSACSSFYALWTILGVRGSGQVAWAGTDSTKRTIVGLVYARGESDKMHVHVAMQAGYGEGPYGRGPYGRAWWMWRSLPSRRPDYAPSQAIYDDAVKGRPLLDPLDEALQWFEQNLNRGEVAPFDSPRR